MLMEEETTKAEQNLANTVTKLALSSKSADDVMRKVKVVENKCSNNEVTLEELDKNLRQTTKMASDNEQKLDELSRRDIRQDKINLKTLLSVDQEVGSAGGGVEESDRARRARREQAQGHRRGAPGHHHHHPGVSICSENLIFSCPTFWPN